MKPKQVGYHSLFMFLMLYALVIGLFTVKSHLDLIGNPFPGFRVQWIAYLDRPIVSPLTATSWPAIAQYGLQINDQIVAINGQVYTDLDRIVNETAQLPTPQQVITYTIDRQGIQLDIPVHLDYYKMEYVMDTKIHGFIAGLGAWLLGLIVYWARPDREENRAFGLGTLVFSTMRLCERNIFSEPWGLTVTMTTTCLFAPLQGAVFMHFASIFPQAKARSWLYRLRFWWYLPALIVLILWQYALYRVYHPSPLTRVFDNIGNKFSLGYFILGAIFGCCRGLYVYHHTASPRFRKQARTLSLGLLFGLWISFMDNILMRLLADWHLSFRWRNLLELPWFYFLIALPYSLLQYQSFRGRSRMLRILTVLMLSVVLAEIYALLLPAGISKETVFLLFFIATAFTSFFWQADNPVKGLFNRLFEREKENYRVLERFSNVMGWSIELSTLPTTIAQTLQTELDLTHVLFWILDPEQHQMRLAAKTSTTAQPESGLSSRIVAILRDHRHPVYLNPDDIIENEEVAELMLRYAVVMLVPMFNGDELIGILGLGPRWSEDIFDEGDEALIEVLARQATLALLVARQIAELRQIPQRMLDAQERERYKIARELHDTTQQFLGRLPFFLETGREHMRNNPQKADEIILECLHDIKKAADELRDIQHEVAPGRLQEKGLLEALRSYTVSLESRWGLDITFTAEPLVETMLTLEVQHALYRVVKQAIDNAIEHAQPERVQVMLKKEDNRVEFAIADDGRGATMADFEGAVRRGHYGIQFMKDRLETLGGSLSIDSELNHGTTVYGYVPISSKR